MNKNIVAYGEIMMRLEVPDNLLLRQAENLKYSFTGTGVNITGLLAQFGYSSSLISAVPDNSIGSSAIGAIRRLGIHSDLIIKNNDNLGMYFLEKGFGNRSSNVTYTNRQHSSFNTTDISKYDLIQSLKDVDILHICGITLAMNQLTRDNIMKLVKAAKEQNIKIVFDCNFRASLWGENGNQRAKPFYETILSQADIVIMNEKDAIQTLGLSTNHQTKEGQLEELLPIVAQKFNINKIAGTIRTVQDSTHNTIKGYLYSNENMYYSKIYDVNILDRIGTGDAYTCGIIHGELSSMAPQDVVSFSTASCVLAHTISGDTPLFDTDDIIKIINNEKNDIER
ncbi:sugar kinase [Staphylococcus gallinarum]|uniref:sugar kinase n=1 Tax=Staphylococcus gallinarum TaxID=1293 RepID=UPI000D1F5003|nr:sugar kinase [Staphylococcus gallinarum]MCD8899714.1 sugar kinase [Staphylococcus gallinarum]MCD8920085.1 sugar kinase [Staphylococcus gallinarum]PTK94310.1 2-dehydro-3-deoxygluconokinase [Staphylococcus gallinarum]PTK94446.1 2-dehydro-3-deoxygluconokinase [Staphylococcus gallinarum]RIO87314.1 sugar kinase [Staphylococcus gallinarum]